MQELEKILEEIESEFDRRIDTQLKIMAGLGDDVYRYGYGKSLEAYQQGKLFVEDIIRKHLNDGWIPVEERLPEEKINPINSDYYEYQVTARFGNDTDVRHYKFGNGHWWNGPGIVDEYVIAWKPRPEVYRPETYDGEVQENTYLETFERKKFDELLKENKAKAVEYLKWVNMTNANLSHVDLSGACLMGIDLRHTDLSGANLSNVNLSHANLSGAILGDTNLAYADLHGANLRRAFLLRANLSNTDMRGANLIDANLEFADLSSANLRFANLKRASMGICNLSNANLKETDMRRANLAEAYMRYANLYGANLENSDLSLADLKGAYLTAANLCDADLYLASLRDTDLTWTILRNANLIRADISNSILKITDLRYANLSRSKGLLDPIKYLELNFEKTNEGYIVYKSFEANIAPSYHLNIEQGLIIEEIVNPDRTCVYGSGIEVASRELIKNNKNKNIFKLLIRWEWLPGVVVPYNTNGYIRCSKAQILEAVEDKIEKPYWQQDLLRKFDRRE